MIQKKIVGDRFYKAIINTLFFMMITIFLSSCATAPRKPLIQVKSVPFDIEAYVTERADKLSKETVDIIVKHKLYGTWVLHQTTLSKYLGRGDFTAHFMKYIDNALDREWKSRGESKDYSLDIINSCPDCYENYFYDLFNTALKDYIRGEITIIADVRMTARIKSITGKIDAYKYHLPTADKSINPDINIDTSIKQIKAKMNEHKYSKPPSFRETEKDFIGKTARHISTESYNRYNSFKEKCRDYVEKEQPSFYLPGIKSGPHLLDEERAEKIADFIIHHNETNPNARWFPGRYETEPLTGDEAEAHDADEKAENYKKYVPIFEVQGETKSGDVDDREYRLFFRMLPRGEIKACGKNEITVKGEKGKEVYLLRDKPIDGLSFWINIINDDVSKKAGMEDIFYDTGADYLSYVRGKKITLLPFVPYKEARTDDFGEWLTRQFEGRLAKRGKDVTLYGYTEKIKDAGVFPREIRNMAVGSGIDIIGEGRYAVMDDYIVMDLTFHETGTETKKIYNGIKISRGEYINLMLKDKKAAASTLIRPNNGDSAILKVGAEVGKTTGGGKCFRDRMIASGGRIYSGECIRFYMNVDRDRYLYIFSEQDGILTLQFPRSDLKQMNNNYFTAGEEYLYPRKPDGSPAWRRVDYKTGKESVYFIFSEKPLSFQKKVRLSAVKGMVDKITDDAETAKIEFGDKRMLLNFIKGKGSAGYRFVYDHR